ncbi:MAG TPA: hypothetical protein VFP33_05465 [Gallionella sp.]|nr:hypothetical protein [Gallionella sp.]
MRTFLIALVVFTTLTACKVIESKPPDVSVSFYKYLGSVQCGGGGESLQSMEQQLEDAGISVFTSTCGTDGNIHAAVCGAADGRIGIFVIPEKQAEAASALGFAPLNRLSAPTEVACH